MQPLTPEPGSAPISKDPARWSPVRPEEGAGPGVWATSHQVPMSSLFPHTGKLALLVPSAKDPKPSPGTPLPRFPPVTQSPPFVFLERTLHPLLALLPGICLPSPTMNPSKAVALPRYLQMASQHPPAWPVSRGRPWRRHLLKCHHHDPEESLFTLLICLV